jgi:hypothetical protein
MIILLCKNSPRTPGSIRINHEHLSGTHGFSPDLSKIRLNLPKLRQLSFVITTDCVARDTQIFLGIKAPGGDAELEHWGTGS